MRVVGYSVPTPIGLCERKHSPVGRSLSQKCLEIICIQTFEMLPKSQTVQKLGTPVNTQLQPLQTTKPHDTVWSGLSTHKKENLSLGAAPTPPARLHDGLGEALGKLEGTPANTHRLWRRKFFEPRTSFLLRRHGL